MNDMTEGPKPVPACVICGKPQVKRYAPFCSKRCTQIDLGRWLNERYVIAGSDSPAAQGEEDT